MQPHDGDYPSEHDDFDEASRHARSQHWTDEEDMQLRSLVALHGPQNWPFIASSMAGREAKQCRERWLYHLAPDIKKGKLTDKEWAKVQQLQKQLGNRWAEIAKHIPGRSPNQIKNHWHSHNRGSDGRKRRRSSPAASKRTHSASFNDEDSASYAAASPLVTAVTPLPLASSGLKRARQDDYVEGGAAAAKKARRLQSVKLEEAEEVKESPCGSLAEHSDDDHAVELLLAAANVIDLEEALKLSQQLPAREAAPIYMPPQPLQPIQPQRAYLPSLPPSPAFLPSPFAPAMPFPQAAPLFSWSYVPLGAAQ